MLDGWFEGIKVQLIEGLRGIKIRHEMVALELDLLKDVYVAHIGTQMHTHMNANLQQLLYRHVVLRTINQQNKFENSIRSLP